MSKVIFLDVDGVLNGDFTIDKAPSGCIGINSKHIVILKEIIDKTKAIVILTSTWKECFAEDNCNPYTVNDNDGAYLIFKLAEYNVYIAGRTIDPDNKIFQRGGGIRKYLKEHPEITNYVILDDDMFSDYTDELKDHLVFMKEPLNNINKKRIIEILNK